MQQELLIHGKLETPAFVIDTEAVRANLQSIESLCRSCQCRFLYSIKALPLDAVMQLALEYTDGFAVSSLFEARLAREIAGKDGLIHLTTPGMKTEEFSELSDLCSHISFNSLSQLGRMRKVAGGHSSGLRVNPKLSLVADDRYNPCRQFSKLGTDIDQLRTSWDDGIEGLHFHTQFGGLDYAPLIKTAAAVAGLLADRKNSVSWLNLGGGYLHHQITESQSFLDLIQQLRNDWDVEIFIEPGNAVVGQAGYLVCQVIDRFVSDGKPVVIVDSSVNHLPEVFEYQHVPPLLFPAPGQAAVCIAGSTCLAGDVFGEYRLAAIPEVGDRLVFKHVGAYSLVKAHRFNGYNLPSVYSAEAQSLSLLKRFDFADFRRHWVSDES